MLHSIDREIILFRAATEPILDFPSINNKCRVHPAGVNLDYLWLLTLSISYHQQIKSKANVGGSSNINLTINSGEKNLEVELEGAIENEEKV